MINPDSINYYIESSFQTRGQTPLKEEAKKSYVDAACQDKTTILKKLRKINYNQFFSNRFQTASIDEKFEGIDNHGKAKLIGNVVDLLFYD